MGSKNLKNLMDVAYGWSLGDPAQVLLGGAAEVDGGHVWHGVSFGLPDQEEVEGDALVPQGLDVHDGAEEVLAEAVVQQDLPLGTERGSYQLADTLFWGKLIQLLQQHSYLYIEALK